MLNGIYVEELANSFLEMVAANRPFTRGGVFVLHNRNTCYRVLLFAYILVSQFQAPAHLCHFFTNDSCVNYLETLPAFVSRLGPLLSDEYDLESNSVITSCK
jgi:hypothetical protein